MKKLIFIVLILACAGCHKAGSPHDQFKWPETGTPCDSLIQILDTQYLGFTPLDSMQTTLHELERQSAEHGVKERMKGCVNYWKGCMLIRQGCDSAALPYFRHSEAADDSDKGYVYHRARYYVNYLSGADSRKQFSDLLEDLDYYEKIGDVPMQAITSGRICNQFFAYGDYTTALRYSMEADSLFALSGKTGGRLKNNLNLSNTLYNAPDEDTLKADRLLRELVSLPSLPLDPEVCGAVLRNSYLHFNDTASLLSASRLSFQNPADIEGHAVYNLLLGDMYNDQARVDSAKKYTQRALKDAEKITSRMRRAMIYDLAARMMQSEGNTDSLVLYMQKAAHERSAFIAENEGARLVAIDNARRLAIHENEKRHLQRENRFKITVIIAIACTLVILALFYVFRKRKQAELKRMESELEMQRLNREITAIALSMEEKDNLFNSITKKLDRMREEHTIQPSVATQLESAINLHLGNKEERENLHTIITGANPKFVYTLTKRHPALNEYYVKLAIFIYIGMDNKQIAKMLMVRPESIIQSRWRLRGKLGLAPDESLDSYLRSLA